VFDGPLPDVTGVRIARSGDVTLGGIIADQSHAAELSKTLFDGRMTARLPTVRPSRGADPPTPGAQSP
jgi:hypothetical protein